MGQDRAVLLLFLLMFAVTRPCPEHSGWLPSSLFSLAVPGSRHVEMNDIAELIKRLS
jgi:hypothetical protein